MTIREYIINSYKETKLNFPETFNREIDEIAYNDAKLNNYIQTTTHLGTMLMLIDRAKRYADSAHYKDAQHDVIVSWEGVKNCLILNCLLENCKPKTELNELGYGYNNFEKEVESQTVMQFLEGYLAVQSVKYDLIHWIELGIKLNYIKLDK